MVSVKHSHQRLLQKYMRTCHTITYNTVQLVL